jgi:hypothetical protein
MLAAVLAEIDHWFETRMFAPLRESHAPEAAIAGMFAATERYFRSGRRVCLVGAIAIADTRDAFAAPVRAYFRRWIETLAAALTRTGMGREEAAERAEAVVAGIQGAIVLSRAIDDPRAFRRVIARLANGLSPGGREQPKDPLASRLLGLRNPQEEPS